jgi:hypothetical protein
MLFVGIFKSVSVTTLQRFLIWMFCLATSQCRANGNLTPMRVQVMDLKGLALDIRTAMPLFKTALGLVDLVAPESVEKILIINAPGFFPVIFAMCRPFMSAKTLNKVCVCGADFQQASATVLV